MTSADALASRSRSAAVSPERWRQLVQHPAEPISRAAAWGLARLAVRDRDWSLIASLLDHDDVIVRLPAYKLAPWIGAADAVPGLRARLSQAVSQAQWDEAAEVFDSLLRLGDEQAAEACGDRLQAVEQRLFTGAVRMAATGASEVDVASLLVAETRDVLGPLVDRAGGELRRFAFLSRVAGEELLPATTVEALRRRDVDAVADALESIEALDTSTAPLAWRREAELRRRVALVGARTIRDERPKKHHLDELATSALVHALLARAAVKGGPTGAIVEALITDRGVWHLQPTRPADAITHLQPLADGEFPRADDVLLQAICAWELTELAEDAVSLAPERPLSWGLDNAVAASRIESALLAALPAPERWTTGELGLFLQLVSPEAEALAQKALRSRCLPVLGNAGLVARTFPTPGVVQAARAVPAFARQELGERLEALSQLDGREVNLPDDAPVLHCRECGEAWLLGDLEVVDLGMTRAPVQAQTCPRCGAKGTAVVEGNAPRMRPSPMALVLGETPASELKRRLAQPDTTALDVMELALYAGDDALAESSLQRVSPDDLVWNAPRTLPVLAHFGRHDEAADVAQRALNLALETPVFDRDEAARIQQQLARSCEALGRPVPPLPALEKAPQQPRTEYRAGRNDPCPCGSGKKFKKCHG